MRALTKNKKSHLTRKMFFDGGTDIARYDEVKWPQIEKITDKQLGFFWRPEEVDILKDANDFVFIFVGNIDLNQAEKDNMIASAEAVKNVNNLLEL